MPMRINWTVSFIKIAVCFVLLSSVWSLYYLVEAFGENSEPKAVLLRLEDVGPGGEYSTEDQLGKLRAVLEMLRDKGVRFQIGVIPKWVNYTDAGLSYERSLDQGSDSYIQAFVKLLKEVELGGAVIGMHGFTHQAGTVKRQDGHQESGIGNEFNETGLPETAGTDFAEARLKAGLEIFEAAGLKAAFWETPHYHSTPEQHRVFRSYFGIIHENAPDQPRQSFLYVHRERNSGYGAASWGAAYVPTPFSYIPYNKDENLILNQLGKSDRLPSFFYHAFLEFKHLVPVLDSDGQPVYRDGLPEYRYPDKNKSNLQKLIVAFRDRDYRFYSLLDYVPFVPWSGTGWAASGRPLKPGDATGDGQLDGVEWREGTGAVMVSAGSFRGMRNSPQPKPVQWASVSRQKGDAFALKDENGDGRADLWIVRASGKVELYRSTGSAFVLSGSWPLEDGQPLEDLFALKRADGTVILAGLFAGGTQLLPIAKEGPVWKAGEPLKGRAASFRSLQAVRNGETGADQLAYCRRDTGVCFRLEPAEGRTKWTVTREEPELPHTGDTLKLGDFNGDGLEDVLLWSESGRVGTVYRRTPEGDLVKLSSFGPWGEPGARLVVADFDGNGKADIAAAEPDGSLDLALSFQTAD